MPQMKQDVDGGNPWTIPVEPEPLMDTSSTEPAPKNPVQRVPSGRHNPCVTAGTLKIADLLTQETDSGVWIDSSPRV